MVTQAQLQAYTVRRPFAPFWVRLTNGETIHVREPNRAVIAPGQMVYTGNGRSLRWIRLREVQGHGPLSPSEGHTDNEATR